jgi:hypothetical protein
MRRLALYAASQPIFSGQPTRYAGGVLFVAVIKTKSSLTSNAKHIPLGPVPPIGGFWVDHDQTATI